MAVNLIMSEDTTHFGFESVSFSEKKRKVNQVFSSVAGRYDLMNDIMSFGLHRLWKQIAIQHCDIYPQQIILDIASGTGDLAKAIYRKLNKTGQLICADLNYAMLAEGQTKLLNQGIFQGITYVQSNAQHLPFQSHSFDRVSIGFGLRNVTKKQDALDEMFRVLKPGGKLMILEFSKPQSHLLSQLYDQYSFHVIPKLGQLFAGDKQSYQYLVESIRMHPDQDTLLAMLQTAGFEQCRYENLTNGAVAIHTGYKL